VVGERIMIDRRDVEDTERFPVSFLWVFRGPFPTGDVCWAVKGATGVCLDSTGKPTAGLVYS